MAMNIIQLQDNLKNLSDQQLTQAMQMPSQDTPPFLVVSELNRRKQMRDSFQAQQASQNQTTVAQDVVAAAGVPQQAASEMAQSLAPQTDMANNTGIMSIPQGGEPQQMAAGGIVKMAEGGGTSKAKPYMPRTSAVLTDPILITMASRKGMSVNDYLQAMSPEERNLVESQSAARANRDRYTPLEPSADLYNTITAVNPSYEEQLISVFPPDPEPVRNRPDFEDYGREGAPSYQERGYAARLPSFDAMLTPNFEETGREPEPGFFTRERVRRATSPSLDELVTQNRMASMEGVNAVRPEYIPGGPVRRNVGAGPSFDTAGRGGDASLMDQANADSAKNTTYYTPNETSFEKMGRDGRGTTPQWVRDLQDGPKAVSRSGLPITGGGYDPLSSPGSAVGDLITALSGATNEDMKKRAVEAAAIAEAKAAPAKAAAQDKAADAKLIALAKAKAAADAKAKKDAKAAADAAGGSGGTGGSGGSGGAGGASGKPSTYEQMLMDAMTNADKKAKQDKWLALAQMGLSLMSSAQPNIGMALGEAGAKGIEALQGARDRAESEKLGLSKELYGIDLMRQKMAASSAAAAAKGKGSGLTANQTVTAAKQAVDAAEGRLGLLGINSTTDLSTLPPDAQLAAKTAINDYNRLWSDYLSILAAVNSGGISAIPSGASEDPTAPDNVSD